MQNAANEITRMTIEDVQKYSGDIKPPGGFDIPGESSGLRATDGVEGNKGKAGGAFDGPWDNNENVNVEQKHKNDEADSMPKEARSTGEDVKSDNVRENNSSDIDTDVKNYNNEVAEKSAGGKTREIASEDLEKSTPEETKEKRSEFNKVKDKLIEQWEAENNQEWPRYKEDVVNDDGKVIRKKGDRYDAHHIQPLELGGKNTADNITPMHVNDHHDKKGIHRVGGPCDNMTKATKEA